MFFRVFLLFIIYNLVVAKKEPKFRVEKINFVWSKAEIELADEPARLNKLQMDLSTFDGIYLNAKHDEDLKYATDFNAVDKKLEGLLQRYDLEEAISAFRMKYKYNKEKVNKAEKANQSKENEIFDDARIQHLWNEIVNDKAFTLSDVDDLYYDLREHEQKLKDYTNLLKQLSHKEKANNQVVKELHEEEDKYLLATAKQMNIELEDNFKRFEKRVTEIKQNPFKIQKVRRLWEKALRNRGLIPNELDVIKTELRHFERHLEKVNFHGEHLKEAEEFSKGSGKEDTENVQEIRDHHEKMLRKIKKLETYLDERLSAAAHTEL